MQSTTSTLQIGDIVSFDFWIDYTAPGHILDAKGDIIWYMLKRGSHGIIVDIRDASDSLSTKRETAGIIVLFNDPAVLLRVQRSQLKKLNL